MTDKEALLEALEALHYCEALNRDVDERKMQAITVVRKLWAEHAMRETQRLGQEIEQEPVVYQCPRCATSMQVDLTAKAALAQTQEPVAYDKTEMNCFVQDLYDKKMQEGKHGHYETMFHVVHQAIKKVPPQRTWVGLTDEDICTFSMWLDDKSDVTVFTAIEARLKELNT